MSKYTTELRFICESEAGLIESVGYNQINEVLALARPKIFSFSYPIFDESYRSSLETKILKHFYTREIGYETYGLFKLKLDAKMNEIMPYYNKLYETELIEFNPLYATDLNRTHAGTGANVSSGTDNNSRTDNIARSTNKSGNTEDSASNTEKYADTPQGDLDGIIMGDYLTNARTNSYSGNGSNSEAEQEAITNTGTNNRTLSNRVESVDAYSERVYGYDGHNPNKMLSDFRHNILNIDLQIIRDLESLFMQVW